MTIRSRIRLTEQACLRDRFNINKKFLLEFQCDF
jgi:hypothetical protein